MGLPEIPLPKLRVYQLFACTMTFIAIIFATTTGQIALWVGIVVGSINGTGVLLSSYITIITYMKRRKEEKRNANIPDEPNREVPMADNNDSGSGGASNIRRSRLVRDCFLPGFLTGSYSPSLIIRQLRKP